MCFGSRRQETVSRKYPVKKKGKREADLSGIPVIKVEHYLTEEELKERFGKNGWKQLPDEIYKRYRFVPAKVEVEEHHVGVYASKDGDRMTKAPHPVSLLRGSLVSPSLEAAIPKHMDDKDLSFCEDLLPWSPNLPEKCRKTEKK